MAAHPDARRLRALGQKTLAWMDRPVAPGFSVTILLGMLYRCWSLESRKLEARPVADAIPLVGLGLVWSPEDRLSPGAQAFRQFLVSAAG